MSGPCPVCGGKGGSGWEQTALSCARCGGVGAVDPAAVSGPEPIDVGEYRVIVGEFGQRADNGGFVARKLRPLLDAYESCRAELAAVVEERDALRALIAKAGTLSQILPTTDERQHFWLTHGRWNRITDDAELRVLREVLGDA